MPRKKRRSKAGRPRGRRPALASVSAAQLKAELDRRARELQNRRDELAAELDEVDRELSELGGPAVRRRPGRPRGSTKKARRRGRPPGRPRAKATRRRAANGRRRRNKASLVESLRKTLSSKTMSVTDAADAVQKAGYKTSSANFRTIVNQALLTNPDSFKRVGRGQYTAK